MASSFFGAFAAVLGVVFVHRSWKLWRSDSDADAMGLFKYSILYLFLIFLALGADATVTKMLGGM